MAASESRACSASSGNVELGIVRFESSDMTGKIVRQVTKLQPNKLL